MKPLDPRLLRHARTTRRFLLATVAVGVASTGTVLLQAALLADVISGAFLGSGDVASLRPQLVALAAVVALRAALGFVGELSAHLSAAAATSELRAALVGRAAASAAGRRTIPSGEAAALATSGLDALDAYFSRYLPQLILAVLAPLAIVAWVTRLDPVSALILALTLPLIPLFMALVGLAARQHARSRLGALSALGAHFLDVVQGLATLRAFRRGRAQVESIRSVSTRLGEQTMATLRVAFLSAFVLELLATLGTAMVAVTVGLRLAQGGLDFRTALTVLILAPEAYLPLRSAGAQFHASADGVAAAGRALDLIEAGDRDRPKGSEMVDLRGGWRIRVVAATVVDPDRAVPALDHLDLQIAAGEHLALVGESGSGKSTLLSVLLGLTPPDSGSVMVDLPGRPSVPLDRIDASSWRAQMAWVPQRPRLFAGTIADNVRLGTPEADEPSVLRALHMACLGDVVARLPDGIHTEVGEDGTALSAGERQRVCLARAFLRDAPLVLLDEPTSNLDLASEAAISTAVSRLARDRTVVVVAHRRRMVLDATRVVRLAAGRVVADGSTGARELVAAR